MSVEARDERSEVITRNAMLERDSEQYKELVGFVLESFSTTIRDISNAGAQRKRVGVFGRFMKEVVVVNDINPVAKEAIERAVGTIVGGAVIFGYGDGFTAGIAAERAEPGLWQLPTEATGTSVES